MNPKLLLALLATMLLPNAAAWDLLPDGNDAALVNDTKDAVTGYEFGIFAHAGEAHKTGLAAECQSFIGDYVTVWNLYVAGVYVRSICTSNAFLENGYWHETPKSMEKTVEHYEDDYVLDLDCNRQGDPGKNVDHGIHTGALTTRTGLWLPVTRCNWSVWDVSIPPAESWIHSCRVGAYFRAELTAPRPVDSFMLEGFVISLEAPLCEATRVH